MWRQLPGAGRGCIWGYMGSRPCLLFNRPGNRNHPVTATRGTHTQERGKPAFTEIDFNLTPFIAFWEMTKACALACRHCRALAQPKRNPMELTTDEGLRLLGEIADMGTPLMVLTGGDALMRPDLLEFIKYGNDRGMRVSLAPSATRLVTP